jgi:putative peptidoglycan lipid II flippase
VLAPGFYSRQDIRTPVKIALLTFSLLTQVLNLAFVKRLARTRRPGTVHRARFASLNAGLLYRGLRRSACIYTPAARLAGAFYG